MWPLGDVLNFRESKEALDGFRVDGLLASSDRRRVTGVRGAGTEVAADLVVDTAGRGSHSPQWLAIV